MSKSKMRTWKFVTYVPGSGAECLSGDEEFISSGTTLKEAKATLVEEVGCTKDFFDDPKYTRITLVGR